MPYSQGGGGTYRFLQRVLLLLRGFLGHMVTEPFNFLVLFTKYKQSDNIARSLFETHCLSLQRTSGFLKSKVILFKEKIYVCVCSLHAYMYKSIYCWSVSMYVLFPMLPYPFASSLESSLGDTQNEYRPYVFSSLMYLGCSKAAVIYQRKCIGLNGEIFNKRQGGALYLIKRA